MIARNLEKPGDFWELSEQLFIRINDENREEHNFLMLHSLFLHYHLL